MFARWLGDGAGGMRAAVQRKKGLAEQCAGV